MTQSSRTKRRRRGDSPNPLSLLLGPVGIAVLMTALIGGLWYRNRPQSVAFEPNTTIGEAAMTNIQTFPDQGQVHVAPGQPVNYDTDFPTSGPHDPNPVLPGVYSQEQRLEELVHSIEHGNIVIYVDQPGQVAMDTLTAWASEFSGYWDGLVVVPRPGLGEEVVLTAWNHKLRLPEFEPEAAATFIDTYRGRGPENPVR
ncbi:DUF3105 domain-containing protein [Nodosilinea sp. E11]|uniref:DUF3105 domain-containing protein n=1 Tax=Nodosilinea sp. E11 TaxID=3037479 RepID=UPI002934CCE7|nr:DUF3105 domain-containing protein [Nodosilinea sp. E11]WOD38504.1 DUF3105 domain-containing protein [Nodosilinea sp. E11]